MPDSAYAALSPARFSEQLPAVFCVHDARYSLSQMPVGRGQYWLNAHPVNGRPIAIAEIDEHDRDDHETWLWASVYDDEHHGAEDTIQDAIAAAIER